MNRIRLTSKNDLSSVFLGAPAVGKAGVTDITSAKSIRRKKRNYRKRRLQFSLFDHLESHGCISHDPNEA